ncbi:MAG: hypothetical protein E7564_09550 [Ruminococcaceae bacterium]|nr:hypothetical protein [Oscillospiraceae bacterium]
MNKIFKKLQFDVLEDNPIKVLLCIILPIIIVNVISLFTASITNDIYSRYVGQVVFTVTGLISTVVSAFVAFGNGVYSAAWIKTAGSFSKENRNNAGNKVYNSIYAIVIVDVIFALIFILMAEPIFAVANIPEEMKDETMVYYVYYIISYILVSISGLFSSIHSGIGSMFNLFTINLISTFSSAFAAFILLGVCNLGVFGVAVLAAFNSLLAMIYCVTIIIRKGVNVKINRENLKPDFKLIFDMTKYGMLIALQALLCSIGYFAVSIQTNKYLSMDYIAVTAVSLPISGPMGAFSSAISIFIPQNFAAGKTERVRKFLNVTLSLCVGYGVVCAVIYAFLGEWYYGTLFADPNVVALGAEYWKWYGLGFIFVAVIYIVRVFYDCIGMSNMALFSGVSEMIGSFICAFWLIPAFGNIGNTLMYPLSWFIAASYLIISYLLLRKKIYFKCDQNVHHKLVQ